MLCIVLLSHCKTRWFPLHEKLEEDQYTQREKSDQELNELCWYVHKERMRRTSKTFGSYSTP